MFCPYYKNPAVRGGFNEMITAFGGKPMTDEEFRDSDLRNLRTGRDWSAMEAAYKVYDQSGGLFLDKVPNSISEEYPDGKDSILFKSLLDNFNGDRNKAIIAKANLFSKGFKDWFGDWINDPKQSSKAVDENGEPQVLYHGTENNFDTFEVDEDGSRGGHKVHDRHSFFFTDTYLKAYKYRHSIVMPVFLNMRNPGISDVTDGKFKTLNEYTDQENGIIKDLLYDSAIFNRYDKEGDNYGATPTKLWVVKSPNLIKSILNNGNFSKFDDNIHSKLFNPTTIDTITNPFIPSSISSYSKLLNEGTVNSSILISDLINTNQISDFDKPIAGLLSRHEIPIKIDNTIGDYKLATSITDKNGNSVILINMDLAKQVSSKYFTLTILHEVIHSVTSNAINNPKTAQLSKFKQLNYKMLNILRSGLIHSQTTFIEPGSSLENALSDEHEFAAEFATDEQTRDEVYRIAKELDQRHNIVIKTFIRFVNALSDLFVGKAIVGKEAEVSKYQSVFKLYLAGVQTIKNLPNITTNNLINRYKSLNLNVLINETITDLSDQLDKDISSLLVHNKLWKIVRVNDKDAAKEFVDPQSAYDNIIASLKSRQDALRTAEINSAEKATAQNAVASLIALFSNAEISKYAAIGSFVQLVGPLILEDVKKIRNIKLNDPNPSAHMYMYLLHGNIGTYENIFDTLQQVLNEQLNVGQIVEEYNKTAKKEEDKISVQDVIDLRELVVKCESVTKTGMTLLSAINSKIAANETRAQAEEVGAYDLYEYSNSFYDASKINDISSRELYMGAADSSTNQIIRLVSHMVNNAVDDAEIATQPVLLNLQKLKTQFGKNESLLDLYEYDDNGLTTGYLVRDLNFGKFWNNYDNYLIKLNKISNKLFNLALDDDNRVQPDDDKVVNITLTQEQAKELGFTSTNLNISSRLFWNTARNNWMAKNGERKYIKKYYDIQAKLPLLAKLALDQYDAQIQSILAIPGVIDDNGNRHYDKLSEDLWKKLNSAWEGKKWLYSLKDENGKEKSGPELEIAKALRDYRDSLNKLRDEQIYKRTGKKPDKNNRFEREYDTVNWKKAFNKVVEECGGKDAFDKWFSGEENSHFDDAKFTKWIRRNGQLKFRTDPGHNVWEVIQNAMRSDDINYGSEHDKLKLELNDLLNPLKDKYGEVNPDDMSESLKNSVLKLQYQIWKIERDVAAKNPNVQAEREKRRKLIDKYISYLDTEYYREIQRQIGQMFTDEETGIIDIAASLLALFNNYSYVFKDDLDSVIPFRWLTRSVAKDKLKYMEYVPNEGWIKRSQDTYLLNDKYDESYDSYVVPKRDLYDNRRAYEKVTKGSLAMQEFYKYAHHIIEEANDMQTNRLYTDDYLLPQITGSFWKRLKNSDHKFKVVYEWLKEQFGGSKDQTALLMYGNTEALDVTDSEGNVVKREDKLYGRYPDGRTYNTLPQYYTRKLQNPSQLSSDLIGILSSYYNMSLRYKNKLAIRDSVESLVDAISKLQFRRGDNTVSGDQSRTFEYLNSWLQMNMYDTTRVQKSFRIPGTKTKICFDKTLSLARRAVTAQNLGLNPKVAAVGFTTSSLANLVWAITGQRYSFSNMLASVKDVAFRVFKKFVTSPKSLGDPLSNDKTQVIMEHFNVSDLLELKLNHTNRNRFILFLYKNSTYGFLSGLDWISKATIVENILRAHRLVDGEFVTKYDIRLHKYELGKEEYKHKMDAYKSGKSLWDEIDTSDGSFLIKDKDSKDAYKESFRKIRARCKKYPEEADGMATSLQRALLIRSWVGVFVALHRQYLPLMLDKYYGKRVYDYDMQEYKNGQHRNILNFLCAIAGCNYFASGVLFGGFGTLFFGSLFGNAIAFAAFAALGVGYNRYVRHRNKINGIETPTFKQAWSNFFNDNSSREASQRSLMNRYQLKQTFVEIALYQVVSFVADALCAWADDSDDDSAWWKYMIAYIARSTLWEYFTPYRTDDLLNNIKSATAATSMPDKVSSFLTGVSSTALNTIFPRTLLDPLEIVDSYNDDSNYFTDEIGNQSKSYAGKTKFERDLLKLFPIHNTYEQIMDSKTKLGYNENQIQHNPRKESESLFYSIFGHNEGETSTKSKIKQGL